MKLERERGKKTVCMCGGREERERERERKRKRGGEDGGSERSEDWRESDDQGGMGSKQLLTHAQ